MLAAASQVRVPYAWGCAELPGGESHGGVCPPRSALWGALYGGNPLGPACEGNPCPDGGRFLLHHP